ncbi:MAG: PspC domain-containing protein [Lachnospiraceae bacterium]|nr:PspC domain-containing protein [Lachnospiraceae bacterium]
MQKQLRRSNNNRILAGVCGGVGEYLGIDPAVVRIIWALALMSGVGFVAYIVMAVLIPLREDDMIDANDNYYDNGSNAGRDYYNNGSDNDGSYYDNGSDNNY